MTGFIIGAFIGFVFAGIIFSASNIEREQEAYDQGYEDGRRWVRR